MSDLKNVTPKNWTTENTALRVRALMERDQMTQEELARILGVSVSSVARWRAVKNKNIPDLRSRVALQRLIDKGGKAA
jgi:transcriptional regulator with XRE-family HTH domain